MPDGEVDVEPDLRLWRLGVAAIAAITRVGEGAERHARAAEARGDVFRARLERQRAARAGQLVSRLEDLLDELYS